jgi:hypothetical protein
VGFKIGAIALQGVAQPENNPAKKLTNGRQNSSKPELFKPISEKTILTQVYNTIQAKSNLSRPSPAPSPKDQPTDNAVNNQSENNNDPKIIPSPQPSASPAEEDAPPGKKAEPISDRPINLAAQSQGIRLTVENVHQDGELVVFNINLKNESPQPVKFSYRFLEIKDEQNHTLSGITEGLPDEIPANSQPFTGQVKIPLNLIQDHQRLTLNLSNYPDKTLTLSVKNIPLVRVKPAKVPNPKE